MKNFNTLDEETQNEYHKELLACAQSIGGVNYFLQLIEELRKSKQNPLVLKTCEFKTELCTIKWTKAIFADKLQLLTQARYCESKTDNLLPPKEDKHYKDVLNIVRTLKPIVFEIKPNRSKDGDGFRCQPFIVIDENTTRLNPMFDVLFFCSVATAKTILLHKPTN